MHAFPSRLLLVILAASLRQLPAAFGQTDDSVLISEEALLRAPLADFRRELLRIPLHARPGFAAVPQTDSDKGDESAAADVADLGAALESGSAPAELKATLLSEYGNFRHLISVDLREHASWRQQTTWRRPNHSATKPTFPAVSLPAALPDGFSFYSSGLIAHRRDNADQARSEWTALLRLPEEQRRFKSVWAAFMMGRCPPEEGGIEWADKWFGRARQLAADGFRDSLGLAAASYGWQARAHLVEGDYEGAIALYLLQFATGDPTAADSLAEVSQYAFTDPVLVKRLARDDLARQVITAYIIARGGRYRPNPPAELTRAFVAAARSAQPLTPARHQSRFIERLAWAALSAEDSKAAAQLINDTSEVSPGGLWIAAKLSLRSGKTDEAAWLLEMAERSFPPSEESDHGSLDDDWKPCEPVREKILEELGAVELARGRYFESITAFSRAGAWPCAGRYLAEAVLTIDELRELVAAGPPLEAEDTIAAEKLERMKSTSSELQGILAGRLFRLRTWDESRKYVDPRFRPHFDSYVQSIEAAHDESLPDDERAAAFWQAARILAEHGYGLAMPRADWSSVRQSRSRWRTVRPGRDELNRAAQQIAAENAALRGDFSATHLAWSAAQLMPDESDETARMLTIAGGWFSTTDHDRADKFYKDLVNRCGTTTLGKVADRKGWFPQLPKP